ncbi:MAG: hypothetical protein IJX15_07055, partial [Ruminiclostridium sp.]|nr:hypothetical protein [Ruminiclostridium sp.]
MTAKELLAEITAVLEKAEVFDSSYEAVEIIKEICSSHPSLIREISDEQAFKIREIAKNNNVTLVSANSFNDSVGTYIKKIESEDTDNVKGIIGYRNIDVVTLENFEDNISELYKVFEKNDVVT